MTYVYLFRGKLYAFDFSSSLSDLAILTAFRVLAMPLLAILGIYLYRTKKQAGRSNLPDSSLRCPLIPPEQKEEEVKEDDDDDEQTKIEVQEDYLLGRKANAEMFDEKAKRARKTASFFKHLCLTFLFVISTGTQVYTGIKTLDFSYTQHDPRASKTVLIVLVCGSILWINLEAWILRELVNELTRDHGLFLKSIHRHALFFDSGVSSHWCDLCGQRVSQAWRCKLCDFDGCVKCVARKKTANSQEHAVRTDKQGVRETKKMTATQYFIRSLKLASSEWKLFIFAFVFLILTSLANLALPNTQGSIVNMIIENNHHEFLVHLKIYIIVMVALGVFNGIKGLLFMIVSRRIAFHARTRLFSALISQDVAFFDGTTSGRLTSRLTNDIGMMLAPIQNTMSTLLYNLVMLFGGIIMCFYTSYKLSMLAFTTVGPILYVVSSPNS